MSARHAIPLNAVQERFKVEARHDDDGCAAVESHVHDDVQAVDVEEGKCGDERVPIRGVVRRLHLA